MEKDAFTISKTNRVPERVTTAGTFYRDAHQLAKVCVLSQGLFRYESRKQIFFKQAKIKDYANMIHSLKDCDPAKFSP